MDSETDGHTQEPVATTAASAQMRAAREAAGLSLEEVAARTRVPQRHLEALERGDYAALPGITYCAGFSRAYARAVGLDEKALVAKVREEIDRDGDFVNDHYQIDEPADPARVPPRSLAWAAAIVAVLLASGYGLWRIQLNTPPGEETEAAAPVQTASPQQAKPVEPPKLIGPVVLTAAEDVWLRIYDADGKALLEKTMTKGESYTVPADANNPMILTGRPDAIAVTVGGRAIPPLGTAERTISDVPISAAALAARTGGVAPAAVPVATAAQGAPAASGNPAPPTTAQQPVSRPATVAQPSARPRTQTRQAPATAAPVQPQAPAPANPAASPSGTTAPAAGE